MGNNNSESDMKIGPNSSVSIKIAKLKPFKLFKPVIIPQIGWPCICGIFDTSSARLAKIVFKLLSELFNGNYSLRDILISNKYILK